MPNKPVCPPQKTTRFSDQLGLCLMRYHPRYPRTVEPENEPPGSPTHPAFPKLQLTRYHPRGSVRGRNSAIGQVVTTHQFRSEAARAMAQPEIAILISSFERPAHIRRVL